MESAYHLAGSVTAEQAAATIRLVPILRRRVRLTMRRLKRDTRIILETSSVAKLMVAGAQSMYRSRTSAVVAVIIVLLAVLTWQFVDGVRTSVRLSFADDQTEIFSEMVGKASDAINQQPPDVKAAVGCLDYTHNYYPSGTKQASGSRLDRIVERSRSLAESRIIEMLQIATGADHGTDPDAWIREFGNQAVSGK